MNKIAWMATAGLLAGATALALWPVSRSTPAALAEGAFRRGQLVFGGRRASGVSTSDFAAEIRRRVAAWQRAGDSPQRAALEKSIAALLTADNAAAIVQALSPDLLATPIGEMALQRWAETDRRASAAWMERLPGATEYQAGLITYGWLAADRAGLHAYLDTLPDDSGWKQAMLRAATNDALLAKDGVEAIGLLQHLPTQPQRDEMLGWATTEWARHEPEQAATWARNLSDPVLQAKLFGATAVGYAWTKPQAAAELLVQAGVVDGDSVALSSVMNIWSRTAPEEAARWASEHLNGDAQQLALRSAVLAWGYHDLAAAQAWVRTLPDGPARTQADRTIAKAAGALAGVEVSDVLASSADGPNRISTHP